MNFLFIELYIYSKNIFVIKMPSDYCSLCDILLCVENTTCTFCTECMCHEKYENDAGIPIFGLFCAVFTGTLPLCLIASCCSYTFYKCCSCKNNNKNNNENNKNNNENTRIITEPPKYSESI